MDQGKFKTRPSSSLFQIARGSGATLRILEITKSVKTTVYTELFTWQRRKPDKNSTDQEKLSTCRVVYMAKTKTRPSTR